MERESMVRWYLIARTALILTFSTGLAPFPVPGQTHSENSYRQARELLEAGVKALGGFDFLRSIRDFTLNESGRVRMPMK